MGGGPPGLGPACGPPSEPPPPAPPGLFLGSSRPAGSVPTAGADDEGAREKQNEISGTIAAQVKRLLEQARLDTENKVKVELKGIRDAMVQMDNSLDTLLAQLDGIEPRAEPPLDAEHIGQLLSKIEQQWGQEIRTLKEELHQTILAHNHNADLIKHHKDTIDALRERCTRLQGGNARTGAEIQQQLSRLDQLTRQQQTQRKMDPLFERLSNLERNVHQVTARNAAWRYPAMPPMPMMPGMRPPMGLNAAMMMNAAGLVPGGKGSGMRPPFGGRAGAGAAVMPEADAAAMAAAGLDAEEDEAAALAGDAGAATAA